MKLSRRLLITNLIVGVILIAVLMGVSFWPYHEYPGLQMRPEMDVANNMMTSPKDQLFASALYNLGYTTFLHQNGPFTVFLPEDKGFEHFTPEMKYFLGQTENSGAIRQMLLYHIVKGKYLFSDLKDGMMLPTVEGDDLKISRKGDVLKINNQSYVKTYDIVSKNGVIHLISDYLTPPFLTQTQ